MPKTYDFSRKRDVDRFKRDLENRARSAAADELHKMELDVTCPLCNSSIKAKIGSNVCPACGRTFELELDS